MDDMQSFTVFEVEPVRWQYRVVNVGVLLDPQQMPAVLAELGADGWDFAHVFEQGRSGFALFKRPVAADAGDPEEGWVVLEAARATVPDIRAMVGASVPRAVRDDDWTRHEVTCAECGEPAPAGRGWCERCGGNLPQR